MSFLQVDLCKPKGIYICDGSEEEATELKEKMVDRGMLIKCDKMDNWWASRHDINSKCGDVM